MTMRRLRGLTVALALVACACAKTEVAETPAAREQSTETFAEAPVDVALRPVTFDAWRAELESMKGSIVVVDLWATWCIPCIERFPKMVEMSERYAGEGVRFVSLSLDDRDDENTILQVTRFLETSRATGMSNYLMDEIIPDAFEKLDLLGIPAVYVYDGSGERRYKLTGDDPNNQFTDGDVEKAVEELVRERKSRTRGSLAPGPLERLAGTSSTQWELTAL